MWWFFFLFFLFFKSYSTKKSVKGPIMGNALSRKVRTHHKNDSRVGTLLFFFFWQQWWALNFSWPPQRANHLESVQIPQNLTDAASSISVFRQKIFKLPLNLLKSNRNVGNHTRQSTWPIISHFSPHFGLLLLCYSHRLWKRISLTWSAELSGVWGLQQSSARSRSVEDLLRAESDPSAWTLSQTQQASHTHTHTRAHKPVINMKRVYVCMNHSFSG